MAHYTFLSSWGHPRMPVGDRNEWREYNAGEHVGLEAKNAIPLFWACLFTESDIKRTRLIDDIDKDDSEGRAAFLKISGYGPDVTYPYFVTAKDKALKRLAGRRDVILAAIGERYAPIYDGFTKLIETRFQPYILIQTADMPDAEDIESWLRRDAASMDKIDQLRAIPSEGSFAARIKNFSQWERHNPIWLLSGEGSRHWPTEELAAVFPEGRTYESRAALPPVGQGSVEPTRVHKFLIDWIAPVLAAVAGLGAGYWTGSWWLGAIAFLATAVSSALLLTRPRR